MGLFVIKISVVFSDGIVLAIRRANKYYLLAWLE
jgi:hypothetical protein